MTGQLRLDDHLQRYSETAPHALAVAAAVDAIAAAAIEIADLIATGDLADASGLTTGRNSDGDLQRDLDVQADAILRRCLSRLPIAALASEEMREPQIGDREAKICVAIDPLDGSSNIDINMTVGTIFSILPAPDDLALAFHQRGSAQLAAGFVTYGPQTSLVLTLGDGVDIFTLDRRAGCFRLARNAVQISETCEEFAINASNRRHWDTPVRAFVDECLAGVEGPANHNFNMRWIGSLVAEAYRILTRGGVFIYPADRKDLSKPGRLRLMYEANPMAFIVEQAGGAASTGSQRMLDVQPSALHQRVPVVLGSREEVAVVERYHAEHAASARGAA